MQAKQPSLPLPSDGQSHLASAGVNASGDDRRLDASCPQRILVATDTSATSTAAELAGMELSARAGASLLFVSVIDPSRLRLPGGLFHTRVDQVRGQRETALGRTVANARALGIGAQFLIWEGDPGASVITAAEAEMADLIIVGSHGRGHLGRLLLGSVSSYVVDHAQRPVLVIRPGDGLDDALRDRALLDAVVTGVAREGISRAG